MEMFLSRSSIQSDPCHIQSEDVGRQESERQTDRDRERKMRQTDRQTETQRHRQTNRLADRQTIRHNSDSEMIVA